MQAETKPEARGSLRRAADRAVPFVGLGVFALAGFVSLLPRWSRSILSSEGSLSGDSVLHAWQFWWVREALSEGDPPLRSDAMFYPDSVDLASLWEGHLDLVLAAPWVTWATPFATANTVALILYAGCGAGVYLLSRALCGDRWIGLAAAMLFLLTPTLLFEVGDGRSEVAAVGLAGPFLLCSIHWFTEGRRSALATAPLCLAVTVLGYLALGPLLVPLVATLAAGAALAVLATPGHERPPWAAPGTLLRRCAIVLIPLGALAVDAMFLARGRAFDHGLTFLSRGDEFELDYGIWLAVSRESSLSLWGGEGGGWGLHGVTRPALMLLVLALPTLVSRRSALRALPWWLGAGTMAMLALGPDLVRVEERWFLPSPYRLIPWISPVFLRFHWPYRFLLLADLCLVVLAAQGLVLLLGRLRSFPAAARRAVLAALVVLAVLIRPGFPLPAGDIPPVPGPYRQIAGDDLWALLELPARCAPGPGRAPGHWDSYVYSQFLAQMEHDAPLCCLEMPEELRPEPAVHRTETDSTYRYLIGGGPPPPDGLDLSTLRTLGYSHVVVHLTPGSGAGPVVDAAADCPGDLLSVLVDDALGPPWLEEIVGRGVMRVYRVPFG